MKLLLKSFFSLLILVTVNSIFAQSTDHVTVVQLSQTDGVYENTSLALAPGKYIFEVTNKDVPRKLGFYLTSTSGQVTNSGLDNLVAKGETAKTGIVELTAGTYQYSCPLNPTPKYSLTVGEHVGMEKEKMMKEKAMAEKPMKEKMMKEEAMTEKKMKEKM